MRKLFFIPLLFAVSLATGQDNSPQQLVDKAIEHAGGWDAWMGTRTLQFRKSSTRFAPDGSVVSTTVQLHRYQMRPSPMMRIEWEQDGSKILLINNGKEAWKYVNGKRAATQEDINSARGSTFGAHYVSGMPWKLRDPGTQLTDGGLQTLADGSVVQKVRVTYAKGAGDAGGMHTWTYMFDPETGRLVCNHLEYAPGKFDWTEYYDEKPVGALIFPAHRVGYNADANGKVGPKLSETLYEDIQSDVDLPAALFAFLR